MTNKPGDNMSDREPDQIDMMSDNDIRATLREQIEMNIAQAKRIEELENMLKGDLPSRVSIYGLYDCHMFHELKGNTIDEIIENWKHHNETHENAKKYGSSDLCPATVLAGDKEIRRVGKMVHYSMVDGDYKYNKKDLNEYREALLDDPDIKRLLQQ